MNKISFHKMVASGNDFIVIDNRRHAVKNPKQFAARACRPHLGVGADGLLLIEPSKKADFFMRIINSDGSEAEACGNGYRLVGLYAHQILGFPKFMRIETLSGEIEIQVKTGDSPQNRGQSPVVKVKMAGPYDYRAKVTIRGLKTGDSPQNRGQSPVLTCAFINTGVPHVVIFTEALARVPVTELGRAIRYHKLFQPRGTNVNFVEVTGKNSLAIRTYERGVEDETLACGTGTVASAVVGNLTGRVDRSVRVKTKSGEVLNVYFERRGGDIRDVFLEGGAQFVYEGRFMSGD